MGLEVAYKEFVGNDFGFLKFIRPLSDLDIDIATRVSDGEEGVFNDHLVWGVFEMDPYVLEVGHWIVEVVVDNVFRQVKGPFAGIGDDRVEVNLEVQEADFWRSGFAVVGEFVATECQANSVRFTFGELDVADKVVIGFLNLWVWRVWIKRIWYCSL